ncbi:MAG: sigma-70 family RNA polymerase sigma factor [Myxococcota bacterium]
MTPADTASYDLGDLRSFERLYQDHFAYVWAVLKRLGVDSIADALQDVFITAYRRRDSYDPARPVRPWLVGIARRIASRTRRGQQRHGRKRDALAAMETVAPPRHVLQARVEARQFLVRFAADLDERHRDVFVLGELHGCTGAEIAQHLGIGVDAAYGRLRKVRKRLEVALLETRPRAQPEPARLQRGFALLLPALRVPVAGSSLIPSVSAKVWLAAGGMLLAGVTTAMLASPSPSSSDGSPTPMETNESAPTVAVARARSATPPPTAEPSAPSPAVTTTDVQHLAADSAAPVPTTTRPRPSTPLQAQGAAAVGTTAQPRPRAPLDADDLDAQTRALAQARKALDARRPDDALRLLEHHARDYPQSPLSQARDALRVEVLCTQGKGPQARGEAAALLRRHPNSNLARHAATLCPVDAGGGRNG